MSGEVPAELADLPNLERGGAGRIGRLAQPEEGMAQR